MVNVTAVVVNGSSVLGAANGTDPMAAIVAALSSLVLPVVLIGVFYGMPYVVAIERGRKVMKQCKEMVKLTHKPVIVLQHHNAGLFGSMIMPETAIRLAKALRLCGGRDVDLVLHTFGGDLFSSIQIAKMIRDYPGNVNAMIPMNAMSGGTMISLACDSIQMRDIASLGPVDPQIGGLFSSYSSKAWQRILKVKGKKADDKSIATSLLAKQVDEMVKTEVRGITGRRDVDWLFKGDVAHSMQFSKKFMAKHGFRVGDLALEQPAKIVEVMDSRHEVVVCLPSKRGRLKLVGL